MEDDYLMIAWVMGKQTEHCPSIHMPRWASRITLDVIGVHVQRLQNISEADAIAEGIDWAACGHAYASTIGAFADLWDGINAKRGYSFESDPWVWRVEFRNSLFLLELQILSKLCRTFFEIKLFLSHIRRKSKLSFPLVIFNCFLNQFHSTFSRI
jgi:hypothetical protein